MNKYYVYIYLDQDNVPFYVGKGKNQRYKVCRHLGKNDFNPFLKNKIRKVGVVNVKIYFFHENITEEEAFYWESYWIKYIGRRDKKEGSLVNLTDGGEGMSGYIISEETKQKISDTLKDREFSDGWKQKISNSMKGHGVSNGTKQKISDTMKGQIPWNKDKKLEPLSNKHRQKLRESAKRGWIRRRLNSYEDEKIKENGDVVYDK